MPPRAPVQSIHKRIKFSAAHFLPHHIGKCSRMHGHTYQLTASLVGPVQEPVEGSTTGMVADFSLLGEALKRLHDLCLDHRLLNDFDVNPTAERVLHRAQRLLWRWLHYRRELSGGSLKDFPLLNEMTLHEEAVEPSCWATSRDVVTADDVDEPSESKLCQPSQWGFARGAPLMRLFHSATAAEGRLLRALASCGAQARVLVRYREPPALPGWADPLHVALVTAAQYLARSFEMHVALVGPPELGDVAARVQEMVGGEPVTPYLGTGRDSRPMDSRCGALVCAEVSGDPRWLREIEFAAGAGVFVGVAPGWLSPDPTRPGQTETWPMKATEDPAREMLDQGFVVVEL